MGKDVIDDGHDVMSQSHNSFRRPFAYTHSAVKSRKIVVLGVRTSPSGLAQSAFDIAVRLARPATHRLSAAFPLAKPRPTGQVAGILKGLPVDSHLGDDRPGRDTVHARDSNQPA